tara:strand:+ start:6469 stop:7785 length:1317 start_codon:yes stop_codon:yes gene_type:complete
MIIVTIHSTSNSNFKTSINDRHYSKLTRFLPSLVNIEETDTDIVFLMAYRVWKRYVLPTKRIQTPGDVGHPWYNRWGYSSFDGSAFAKIKMSKKSRTITILADKIPATGNSKIDMRLLQSPKNGKQFFVTYNSFGKLNPIHRKHNFNSFQNKHKCFFHLNKNTKKVNYSPSNKNLEGTGLTSKEYKDSYCTFQNTSILTFDRTIVPTFTQPRLVCPNHHKRVEKNISMYFDDKKNKIGYQYNIVPWTFFKPGCKLHVQHKNLFKRIADFYDPDTSVYYSKTLQFSCSTPLIPYKENLLIAAGHFKIKYNNIHKLPAGSPALLFCRQLLKELKIKAFSENHEGLIHYELIYGMFLYTVNKNTLRFQNASDSFIAFDKSPNALMFPSGITSSNDKKNYYISYHENDINMKVLQLSSKEIDKMLTHTIDTHPDQYKFKIIK